MIDPMDLLAICEKHGFGYFVGVPDSVLKDFCACISDQISEDRHVIAANEGTAIGMAAGWYLGSADPALVYMQNSGIGNSINPLVSLTDPEVYGIPMLLLIGWRGLPGSKDEPQHAKQGRITTSLLEALEIPFYILNRSVEDVNALVAEACESMFERMAPVAILVEPGTFRISVPTDDKAGALPLHREAAIKIILDHLRPTDLIVSTTGRISRELYEYRKSSDCANCGDFMTVGSMGHASSIALGLSSALPDRRVVCLDGDGSLIMHMGSMAIIGQKSSGSLIHIVLNNGSHESVGGQPTVGFKINMVGLAESCGYRRAVSVCDADELVQALDNTHTDTEAPIFIEVKVNKKTRDDLGRPKESPIENRNRFMRFVGESKRG